MWLEQQRDRDERRAHELLVELVNARAPRRSSADDRSPGCSSSEASKAPPSER
jgi:hypothetical protein